MLGLKYKTLLARFIKLNLLKVALEGKSRLFNKPDFSSGFC